MKINVRFFAGIAEKVGHRTEEWEIQDLNMAQFKQELGKKYPDIELELQRVMIAVNEEFTTEDQMLKDGDEVAIIPPVSGG